MVNIHPHSCCQQHVPSKISFLLAGQNGSSDKPLLILFDHANPLTINALEWLYYSGEHWSYERFFNGYRSNKFRFSVKMKMRFLDMPMFTIISGQNKWITLID